MPAFDGDWTTKVEEFNSILRTPDWAENVNRILLPMANPIKKFKNRVRDEGNVDLMGTRGAPLKLVVGLSGDFC